MTFSDRLKKLRNERGCSLRDVAASCNISKSAIEMYENGKRKPKIENAEALADYFNVNLAYLMGWEDEQQNTPDEPKLTEGEKMLIDLFRRIPEDKQPLVLQMIRAASGSQE